MGKGKSTQTLKWYEVYGYGIGGLFAYSFYLMLQAYYLLYFLTDVLMINATVAASIYTATNVIKAVTMIIAGPVVDATCLRFGKYRSWIAIGAVGTTIFATLMFMDLHLPTAAMVPVFIIVYVLQSFSYNVMWTSGRSLVGPMSKTSGDAVALAGAAQAGSSLGGIIYGLINSIVLGLWAFTGQPYGMTMLTYCILICLGTILMLAISKKYDSPASAHAQTGTAANREKVKFSTMLKSLKGPMIPYFCAMTLGSAQSGFFFALLTYFTTYVLNNPAMLGYSVTASSIMAFVGAMVAKPVFSIFKGNKKAVYIVTVALGAVCYVLIRIFGQNAVVFLIIYALIGFFTAFSGVLLPAFANDLADYQEMREEGSARAFVQSVAGLSIRLASVISTTVAAFGLAMIGYKSDVEMTDTMLSGIINLMAIGPVIVCVLACLCFLFYKVDEKKLDEYRAKKSSATANKSAGEE